MSSTQESTASPIEEELHSTLSLAVIFRSVICDNNALRCGRCNADYPALTNEYRLPCESCGAELTFGVYLDTEGWTHSLVLQRGYEYFQRYLPEYVFLGLAVLEQEKIRLVVVHWSVIAPILS